MEAHLGSLLLMHFGGGPLRGGRVVTSSLGKLPFGVATGFRVAVYVAPRGCGTVGQGVMPSRAC